MTDRQSANRKLSEWLGFKQGKDCGMSKRLGLHGDAWFRPIGVAKWELVGPLPDFWTDPAANVLLLEKLLDLGWEITFVRDERGTRLYWKRNLESRHFIGPAPLLECIADAALIESNRTVKRPL